MTDLLLGLLALAALYLLWRAHDAERRAEVAAEQLRRARETAVTSYAAGVAAGRRQVSK